MVSFTKTLLALAGALVVSADYYIDPTTVSLSLREAWCRDEKSTCPSICLQQSPGGTTKVNTCDPKTLTYGCVCGDGLQPNVSEYSLTLPYHVCQQWGENCVKSCAGDNTCSSSCRQDHPCGAQSPTRINVTTTTSASSTASTAAATSNQVANGLAGQDNSNSNNNNGGSAPGSAATRVAAFGSVYGLAIVLGGLFTGFALML
ncbi:hypothetical protein B0T26DRAFT_88633 [Lasiosphaeria miniovina]|uniref:DUF7707 domain-containing protein n=1 Tax=Lasiosphaeria miniovina TaxID=1954250 RepID=A0AA40EB05_9PEZI|nr:uncharacterized protein B0T26DRAFT_88633 [Lasiosphaeria miniovina]KAK0734959.1 hypothetical protein B0T26DRAFT_88633 [Lasiosphaeria miniovina]